MSENSARQREFLIWPSMAALGLVLALVLTLAVANGFSFGLFVAIPLLGLTSACICLVAFAPGWLLARRSVRTLSLLIFPVVVALFCFNFTPAMRGWAVTAEYLRFYVGYPLLRHPVAQVRQTDQPRLVVITTSGFISMSNGIAFNERDELAKPVGQQSAAWKARAEHTEFGAGDWSAVRIQGHWYRFSAG